MELVMIIAGCGLVSLAGYADRYKRKTWLKQNVRANDIGSKFVG